MSKWLEAKQIKGKFYISSSDFSNVVKEYKDKIAELEQENRKLSEGKIIYASEKEQRHYVDILEENLELKSELSKFSEAYKRYRDYEKEELAESCYDLARENEKLKEEIGRLVMK